VRVAFYDCGDGNLGVQYLLAVLKSRGHDARLFFDNSLSRNYLAQDLFVAPLLSISEDDVCRGLLELEPEVACFSLFTYFYRDTMSLIRRLKHWAPELPIICGGVHATIVPEIVIENPEVDFVVVGEAEASLPILIAAIEDTSVGAVKSLPAGAMPGVWNVSNGAVVNRGVSPVITDLDTIAFPDKRQHVAENPSLAVMYTMVASRGCFGQCTYCNSATLNRIYHEQGIRYYRVRSVENVIEEIRLAVQEFHPRHIEFYDDCFGAKRSWLRDFCARYKSEIGLPFGIQTAPTVHDEESIELLADAGCVCLEFGLQSANPDVRRYCLNRKESNEAVKRLIRKALDLGIFIELDLILNLPGETREHIQQAIEFVRETRPQLVHAGFLQYFPRTPIVKTAIEQGVISADDVPRFERGEQSNSMRLLSRSGLDKHYRILPMQIFVASRLPGWLSRPLVRAAEWPIISTACSLLASPFIYASRLVLGFTDSRNTFARRQAIRTVYGAKWVLRKKCSRRRR